MYTVLPDSGGDNSNAVNSLRKLRIGIFSINIQFFYNANQVVAKTCVFSDRPKPTITLTKTFKLHKMFEYWKHIA